MHGYRFFYYSIRTQRRSHAMPQIACDCSLASPALGDRSALDTPNLDGGAPMQVRRRSVCQIHYQLTSRGNSLPASLF